MSGELLLAAMMYLTPLDTSNIKEPVPVVIQINSETQKLVHRLEHLITEDNTFLMFIEETSLGMYYDTSYSQSAYLQTEFPVLDSLGLEKVYPGWKIKRLYVINSAPYTFPTILASGVYTPTDSLGGFEILYSGPVIPWFNKEYSGAMKTIDEFIDSLTPVLKGP